MAEEVRSFAIVIPANTARAANFSADMSFPARIVREVDIRIPPGPRGEVGFSIGSSGQPILPLQAGAFIVTDNEEISWPLEEQIDSGSWTLFGYNTGQFDHTLYVRFLLAVPRPSRQIVAPLGGGPGSQPGPGLGPGPPPPPPLPPPPPPLPPPGPPGPPGLPLFCLPPPPSFGAPKKKAIPERLLFAIQDLGEVWLLDDGRYQKLQSQQDLSTLSGRGIECVQISASFHRTLLRVVERQAPQASGRWRLGGQLGRA